MSEGTTSAERRELRVQLGDLLAPRGDALEIEAIGHPESDRVVGHRDVRVALVARTVDHVAKGVPAIGPIGVRVQITLQLLDAHERGQGVRERRIDLAVILAELGRDPIHAERGVDLFLGT